MMSEATEVATNNVEVVAMLVEALQNLGFSDMALVNERNGRRIAVPAFLLASCSPVGEQMLTGPIAEGPNRG